MRIVVFGLAVSSAWGNGHATLWRGLIRALTRSGHDVVFFEKDVPYYAAHRDLVDLGDATLVLYADWDGVADRARRELDAADAGIVTSYCPDGVAASGLVLASRAVSVFYDLDAPVTLARLEAGEPVPYLPPQGLGDFDRVLSYTGGAVLDRLRDRLGARDPLPLYGSVDPDVHRCDRSRTRPAFRADLSYLGTYSDDRQQALTELLVAPAERLPDQRFVIGGAQYPESFPWRDNLRFVGHVAPPDHPAFYSASRLTLNVTRGPMKALGWCPSARLFEAAACGIPVLSDPWDGLDAFFAPGSEILVGRSRDDTLAALSMDDGELARIGARARERVLDEHTAAHRAAELISLLARTPSAAPVAAGGT